MKISSPIVSELSSICRCERAVPTKSSIRTGILSTARIAIELMGLGNMGCNLNGKRPTTMVSVGWNDRASSAARENECPPVAGGEKSRAQPSRPGRNRAIISKASPLSSARAPPARGRILKVVLNPGVALRQVHPKGLPRTPHRCSSPELAKRCPSGKPDPRPDP